MFDNSAFTKNLDIGKHLIDNICQYNINAIFKYILISENQPALGDKTKSNKCGV